MLRRMRLSPALGVVVGIGCSSAGTAAVPSAGAPHEDIDPTTAFEGPVPSACQGTRIDLTQLRACQCKRVMESEKDGQRFIRAGSWCGPAFEQRGLPPAVRAALRPMSAVVDGGATLELTLTFDNASEEPAPVRFLNRFVVRGPRVFDAAGQEVTSTGNCGQGMSGSYDEHLVMIAPGGRATFRLPWRASSMHCVIGDDGSPAIGPRPYDPGVYRVDVEPSIQGAPVLSATVQVR